MGMDVELTWPDKPSPPGDDPVSDAPEVRAWWDAYWALGYVKAAGTHGSLREQYGVSQEHPCELCPLIAEVFDEDKQVEDIPVANARIPASVLRERVPAAQERMRVRYGVRYGDSPSPFVTEQVKAIDAWVALAERLEAEGVKPIIRAFT